jgi:hypothetical protein
MHICPSPIKQTTPLAHNPHIHDAFHIHFDKLAMGQFFLFAFKNQIIK